MDLDRLDHLARSLAAVSTRRRLLGLLGGAPVAGGLLTLLEPEDAEGKKRRRRRKGRHKKRQDKAEGKRQRRRSKRGCKPKQRAAVCAGTCGTVKNRQTCGKRVDCGACACTPACGACFTCQAGTDTPGTCVPDATQVGTPCGSPGQVCQPDGTCACTEHAQCGDASICVDGACHACDVCQDAAACTFTSVQAAVADTSLETIYVCPGTYTENLDALGAVFITRPLHLIGAGDEGAETANTILKPGGTNKAVVAVYQTPAVTLQGLRVTGGTGLNGRGVYVNAGQVEVIDCTVTGNHGGSPGGGIAMFNSGSSVTLTRSHITGNTGASSGGVEVQGDLSSLTLDAVSRITGNHASSTVSGYGGIRASNQTTVTLPSAANVTNNTSATGGKNCGGGGTYKGAGDVCTEQ